MSKTRQLASIRVGYCEFKIIEKRISEWERQYLLYRCWYEPTGFGGVHHKQLDCKCETLYDALAIVTKMAEHYHFVQMGCVPTIEQISV